MLKNDKKSNKWDKSNERCKKTFRLKKGIDDFTINFSRLKKEDKKIKDRIIRYI